MAKEPIRLDPGAGLGAGAPWGRGSGSALDSLRRQIDRLLEDGNDGVYSVDENGRATMVTPSVVAMTGHPVGELLGRAIHEVLHHSHANGERYPRECCPIFTACRNGQAERAEELFWRRDGSSFPIEYSTTPVVQGGVVVGGVVVFRDLSRRRALRDQFWSLLETLDQPQAVPPAARGPCAPIGRSAAWSAVMQIVQRLAASDTTTLLLGESGTGKELVARAIHQRGPRRARPLVTVNCGAIPTSLIESELFGHEKGAFTGATAQRVGRFEQAEGGTLFLDEVGELPLESQAKLLRVLQERQFERVGGTRTIPSRARIVAATNVDLGALVAAGRFRADLYYRLSVVPLRLPPLRERREDIPALVAHFLARLEARLGRPLRGFSPQGERQLVAYDWPGNVRELENVIERAALLSDGPVLEVPPLEDPRPRAAATPPQAIASPAGPLTREQLLAALERAAWKVTGQRGVAAALGVHPNTIRKRMRRLAIQRQS